LKLSNIALESAAALRLPKGTSGDL